MTIEIIQLHDIDDDGEVGSPQQSWYCAGHVGIEEFVHALVNHCIDYGNDVPRIDMDDVNHLHLRKVGGHNGSWTADFRDELPERGGKSWEPVTVYETPTKLGGMACSVSDCRRPTYTRHNMLAVLDATDGQRLGLNIGLCREHRDAFPDPYYRVFLVPVGATIQLPVPIGAESES